MGGGAVGGTDVAAWVLTAIVTTVMVYLAETTSNTASTATFLRCRVRSRWVFRSTRWC